jgi:hypothetical protein
MRKGWHFDLEHSELITAKKLAGALGSRRSGALGLWQWVSGSFLEGVVTFGG